MAAAPQDIHAIFFDNDQHHINQVVVCPRIRCVKVPGVAGMPPKVLLNTPEFARHMDGVTPAFVNTITGNSVRDRFDAGSGFRSEDDDTLEGWIRDGAHLPAAGRYAIFDFDRTISQMEGFAAPPSGLGHFGIGGFNDYLRTYNLSLDLDMFMTYLCGSDRIALLRRAFDRCRANGINIVVLTNNGTCVDNPLLIQDFMSVFGLTPADFMLICSSPHDGNKKQALEASIAPICVAGPPGGGAGIGGGRARGRKLTRKSRKHRNKSRKHRK